MIILCTSQSFPNFVAQFLLSPSVTQTRVGCLVCIGKLLEHMDKWFVLDEVLPLVMEIPSKEPAVLMGILGKVIYHLSAM